MAENNVLNFLTEFMNQTWGLYVEVSIYLLFGFAVAGLLHLFFPKEFVGRHLGKGNAAAVIKASLFGIPLPLCSCGVIPTALSLRKRGASRGATLSFLISTPQTGVDSILLTAGLFGPFFALLRASFSMLTAMITGLVSNLVDKNDDTPFDAKDEPNTAAQPWTARLADTLHYTFVELFGSIYKWLVAGLIIAGVISAALPDGALEGAWGHGLTGKLVMLVISIPMYICATASTPIAFGLVAKGMSLGGAFVFLMAGPATNAATITMVARYLGRRSVVIYLVCIATVSVASGVMIDTLMPEAQLPFAPAGPTHNHRSPLQYIATAVMSLMIVSLAFSEIAQRRRNRNTKPGQKGTDSMSHTTLTLTVKGMTCMHCQGTVERVVGALPGITSVQVDLAAGTVQIAAAETLPPTSDITQAIEGEGFEVAD